jgi:hypothetical protein
MGVELTFRIPVGFACVTITLQDLLMRKIPYLK